MKRELYRKILIATDGSDIANRAVSAGIDFAKSVGARVYVVYVIANRLDSGKDMTEYFTREGEEALKYAQEVGKTSEIELETALPEGIPEEEIINFAEKNKIDLIVVGSLGRTGHDKFLLGSVAENIIKNSKAHVLVVR